MNQGNIKNSAQNKEEEQLTTSLFLTKVLLLIVIVFAVYLGISLISFSPSDPGWSKTAQGEPIYNMGGHFGAWVADIIFFCFGLVSYCLPVIIVVLCVYYYKFCIRWSDADYFTYSLRIIGAVFLILNSCSLLALNFDDLSYFAAGGVLGSLYGNFVVHMWGYTTATLFFLLIWAIGFSLFTSLSWLTIVEFVGWLAVSSYGRLRIAYFWLRKKEPSSKQSKQETQRQDPVRLDPYIQSDALFSDYSSKNHELQRQVNANKTEEVQLLFPFMLEKPAEQFSVSGLYNVSPEQGNHPMDEYNAHLKIPDNEPAHLYSSAHSLYESSNLSDNSSSVAPARCTHPTEVMQTEDWSKTFPQEGELSSQSSSTYPVFMPYSESEERTGGSYHANGNLAEQPLSDSGGKEPLNKRVSIRPNILKRKSAQILPRPKPVRIPTKRELMAYGIPIPSKNNNSTIDVQYQKNNPLSSDEFMPREIMQPEEHTYWADDESNYSKSAEQPLLGEDYNVQDSAHYYPDLQESKAYSQNQSYIKTQPNMDGLVHPFLMRSEFSSGQKPKTALPTLSLLTPPPTTREPVNMAMLQQVAKLMEMRLSDYRIKAKVVNISPGPVITLFELELAPGVKASRISNLSRDLARSLSVSAVRVVEVIPGRPYVGLELPNKHRQTVYLREVLDCEQFRKISSPLAIVLGKDISGMPVVADLAKMPHLLVAGTTGSGKSVGVNAMIISMLYKATPDSVRFIMIDPKMLELSVYEGIPHLLTEVVTDMKDATSALSWCVGEMEKRYKLMSALGVRNLLSYNERIEQAISMGRPVPDPFWKPGDSMHQTPPTLEKLPYIVVIVDEFADLMMTVGKKVEELIASLAQKARASGINLILATQRPSVDVITGLIKANIPCRIAFTVSSKIDSRTILDQSGAESLLGMGDMLYLGPNSSTPIRIHGAFVRDEEVHAVVQDWKARGKPQYIKNITASNEGANGVEGATEELDLLFDSVVAFIAEKRRASISAVQRQFRIGYNRAARIIEQMEAQGIISPPGNNGNREVLIPPPFD